MMDTCRKREIEAAVECFTIRFSSSFASARLKMGSFAANKSK